MELFKLFGRIAVENSEANASIDETTDKAETSHGKLSNTFKKIGKVTGGVLTGIAGAGTAVVGGLTQLSDSTRDYRTEMGKLDTAFTTSGHSSESAKKTYQDLYAVLGETDQSVEAANHLSKLCQSEEELQSWTDICTGVFATFGDSLPIEGLTEAANETAKVGQVTGPLADALNWAGVSEDEFNKKLAECSSEQERQKIITSTLTSLYSEASDQYKETNKDIMESNRTQASLSDTMAKFGAIAEPLVTKLISLFVKLLQPLTPAVETIANKLMPPLTQAIDQIFPVLISLIETLLPPLTDIMTTVLPVVAELITSLLPPIVQIAEMILPLIVSLLEPLLTLLEPIFALLQPFLDLLVMILEPLTSLLNLILTPLIESLTWLINGVLSALTPVLEWIANFIGTVFNVAIQSIQGIIEGVATAFTNAWNGIKAIWEPVANFFSGIWDGIKNAFSAVGSWFSNIFTNAWNGIKKVFQPVANFFSGIWNGIKSAFSNVASWFSSIFTNAWNGIKNAFSAVGGFFSGIWNGIKNTFSKVSDWFGGVFSKAWQAVKNVFSTGGKIFDGIKDGILNGLKAVINAIIGGINKVIALPFNGINWALEKIKGINILGLKPFDWIQTIGVPQIPYLAKGGVVEDKTTAVVGEQGAEAIVPLENNTGWIKRVAEQLESNKPKKQESIKLELHLNIEKFVNSREEDIEELAERLMNVIQEKIDRKGVVFA